MPSKVFVRVLRITHVPTDARIAPMAWSAKAFGTGLGLRLAGVALALVPFFVGCRGVPFHKGTGKDSQALILNREGVAALEGGQLDEASRKFAQAIKKDENDLSSRRYYAEILWRKGSRDEALRCLADAADRDGPDDEKAAIYESLAEKFLEMRQPTAALNYANKVVDLAPRRHEGWELCGMVLQEVGKNEEALAAYHRALVLAPNDRRLLRNLAVFEGDLGDHQRALAAWEELGRFYPDHSEPADVLCGKALACRGLGRDRQAAEYYATATGREPDDPRVYAYLADAYLEKPTGADFDADGFGRSVASDRSISGFRMPKVASANADRILRTGRFPHTDHAVGNSASPVFDTPPGTLPDTPTDTSIDIPTDTSPGTPAMPSRVLAGDPAGTGIRNRTEEVGMAGSRGGKNF